jgi:hypothetical protein
VGAAHAAAKSAGLQVAHYLLLGGPGETAETVAETLGSAETLAGGVLFFFCGLRIYPGTRLHRQALQEGQVTESQDLLPPVFYQPGGIRLSEVQERLRGQARNRRHWVVGAGSAEQSRAMARLYAHGHVGPLWEWLLK